MKNGIKIYIDTSVFGGVFDPEFESASKSFISELRSGRFLLVTSEVVKAEIELSPPGVKDLYDSLVRRGEIVTVGESALRLMDAYIASGIVGKKSRNDALHVALATIAECSIIVSWNFKHIVNFQKIPLYNAVNLLNGYSAIQIYSPYEVVL
ncbi:MAG: type II toxin-antitoxin system VapC family toxin [Ignavibacteriales bacterium]|nr:type II toxin-antitoxin system VapC family toxin [Ignavibacteriales bacterium]